MLTDVAGEIRVLLRLNSDLHATLKQIAAEEDRSLNGQINRALRQWLEDRQLKEPAPPRA